MILGLLAVLAVLFAPIALVIMADALGWIDMSPKGIDNACKDTDIALNPWAHQKKAVTWKELMDKANEEAKKNADR